MKYCIAVLLYFTLLFSLDFYSYAQTQHKADSLLALLPPAPDSTKVKLLLKISDLYLFEDTVKFRTYLQKAESIAQKQHLSNLEGKCKQEFASYLYNIKGEHIAAIKCYQEANKLFEKTNNNEGIAKSYYYLGFLYRVMGDYTTAMSYAIKILKMPEIQKKTNFMARTYDLLGQIYYLQNDFKQALSYQTKGLEILRKEKDDDGVALLLNNLSTSYLSAKDHKNALASSQEAIDIYAKLGDSLSMTYPLHNKGDIYLEIKQYQKAMPYFLTSIRVYAQSGSTLDAALDYTKVAMCYNGLKQPEKAEFYIKKGLKLAQHNNEYNSIADSYEVLSKIDSLKGNFLEAMQYYQKAVVLRDSLDSKEKSEQMTRMKTMYDVDKKDADNLILVKEQELQQKTIKHQYFIIFGAIIGFLFCVGLAIVLYRANKQSKAANRLLQEQQEQIAQQNEELRQQNEEINAIFEAMSVQKNILQNQHKEITDSINYAQRIQQAILPFANRFDNTFGAENYFILYQPRNVVSGDFYWLYEGEQNENQNENQIGNPNQIITLIVADCTGHGVPGAFMSMIGTQLLQEIVIQKNITSPENILINLQREIAYALQQKQSKTHDGMDIVVLSIDRANKKVLFSGAMNSIFYVQNHELIELKGDKNPIGGVQIDTERSYTLKTIDCDVPTTFYLVSDGYQDQFGGERDKKFTSRRMKELFAENHLQPMEIQKNILETAINEWIAIANETQTDDITVMGIKI